jgi:hypothetical protein
MNIATFVLSVLSFIAVTIIGYLQWRTASQRSKSGEALDWSTAARNLRDENDKLRADLRTVKDELKIVKELARRLIKNPPEKGDVIILSPIEQALLFDTNPNMKSAK